MQYLMIAVFKFCSDLVSGSIWKTVNIWWSYERLKVRHFLFRHCFDSDGLTTVRSTKDIWPIKNSCHSYPTNVFWGSEWIWSNSKKWAS